MAAVMLQIIPFTLFAAVYTYLRFFYNNLDVESTFLWAMLREKRGLKFN